MFISDTSVGIIQPVGVFTGFKMAEAGGSGSESMI